jgi:putative MATE family efflux protein
MDPAQRRPENKMGTMPVNRLLLSMSIPMMISMLVQAMYNIVDSMYVSRVSEAALTAVSLAFPMQNLMIAVGVGTCVGVNALLSRSLGAREFEQADKAANTAIFLAILNYLLFALIGIFLVPFYFRTQTDIAEIVNYGCDYLFYCCTFSVGLFGQLTFARLLQSTGKTLFAMIIQMTGAITNILLDPIFIFGWFGFPRMEVAGAAIATVTGQILAMLLGIFLNLKFNGEITLSLRGIFHPHGGTVRRIYSVGAPSIAMNAVSSVMIYGLDLILIGFSATATAVFGVYFKLQSFVFMPVIGLNNGMVPIIAYNYGARKKERMIKTFRLAATYAVTIMITGMIVFQLFPDKLLLLFNASENMLGIGVPALRIISLSYLFPGFCIVTLSSFQALGHGFKSMLVSLIRQMVVLLPAAYLLSMTGRLELVWYSFPIAEIVAVLLCVIMLIKVYRQEVEPLEEQQA